MYRNYFLTISFFIVSVVFYGQEYLNENFNTSTFPPTGWVIETTAGSEAWVYSQSKKAALADSWTIEKQDTWLITPKLNLTTNAVLSFKVKADELVPPDNLFVKIATSDIAISNFTTELLAIKVGKNVTKNYQEYLVDLSAYTGQQIYIGFHHKTEISSGSSYGASGFYLDDIKVDSNSNEDIALVSLISPHNGDVVGNKKVSILLKNTGNVNITANKIQVNYTISGGNTITETVPNSLNIGDTLLYEFTTLTTTTKGENTINVMATTNNDSNHNNNSKNYTFNFFENKSLDEDFSGVIFLPIGWRSYFISGIYGDRLRRSGNTLVIKSTSSNEANDMVVTPKLTIDNNYFLKFSINAPDYIQAIANNPSSIPKDQLVIKISETGNNIGDFTTTVKTIDLRNHYQAGVYDEFNFKDFTINLNAYSGKKIYIALDYTNNNGFGIGLNYTKVGKQSALSTVKFTKKLLVDTYPNPTSNFIKISNINNAVAHLFNLNGKQLLTQDISKTNNTIKMQHLPSGVYFLRISKYNTTITKKIIKR